MIFSVSVDFLLTHVGYARLCRLNTGQGLIRSVSAASGSLASGCCSGD